MKDVRFRDLGGEHDHATIELQITDLLPKAALPGVWKASAMPISVPLMATGGAVERRRREASVYQEDGERTETCAPPRPPTNEVQEEEEDTQRGNSPMAERSRFCGRSCKSGRRMRRLTANTWRQGA